MHTFVSMMWKSNIAPTFEAVFQFFWHGRKEHRKAPTCYSLFSVFQKQVEGKDKKTVQGKVNIGLQNQQKTSVFASTSVGSNR